MGRRATRMLARFEGFNLIVESMFPRLKYTARSFMSPESFVRCVWSELPNNGIIEAPCGDHSYWWGPNHCSDEDIQVMYLLIPPLVARFHRYEDMFPSFINFLCCSIWHMFPEPRLLREEFNAFSRIAVEETCVIIVTKIVWFGRTISNTLCPIPKSPSTSHRTFRETFWIKCGTKWSCWR